jgi:hypothetical protein
LLYFEGAENMFNPNGLTNNWEGNFLWLYSEFIADWNNCLIEAYFLWKGHEIWQKLPTLIGDFKSYQFLYHLIWLTNEWEWGFWWPDSKCTDWL